MKQATALPLIAYELDGKVVVDVPNILLQSAQPITVYRYINNADNSGHTLEEQQFKVKQRAKPDDYVYTETEVLNYITLDRRITAIEENGGSGGSGGVEVDPTVPAWAKQPNKPTYTADEVGAYTKGEVDIEIGKVETQTDSIKSDLEGLQQQLNEESHFRGYLSTNAKIQALEATPNDFAYSAESGTKWVYDAENGWVDTGIAVPDQLTPASDTTPLVNGTPTPGQANEYARGDHRHPTDTTRVGVDEFNLLKQDIETELNKKEDNGNKVDISTGDASTYKDEDYPTAKSTVSFINEIFGNLSGDIYIAQEMAGSALRQLEIKADKSQIGDIETALDNIIAIQNSLIGGGSV